MNSSLRRRIAYACSALILALYGVAWAQTAAQDGRSFATGRGTPPRTPVIQGQMMGGISRSDSVFHVQTMDSDGNLLMKEAAPPTSVVYKYTQAINNRLVTGNSDSSSSLNVLGANHIILMVTVTPDSATCSTVWALQIRRHHDSFVDTSSTWPMTVVEQTTTAAATQGVTPPLWLANGAADTIGTVTQHAATIDTALWINERVMAVPSPALQGFKSRMFSFEVFEGNRPFVAQRMSIRVRQLRIYGIGNCVTRAKSASATIRVDVVGTR